MVGTGLVLWTVKRRAKLPDPDRPYFGFRLVERLNIAGIAGLSIAMAAFLWGNRLLPPGIAQRGEWEIHLFFMAWGLTLAHTLLRPAKRAWLEQLWTAALLLAWLSVLNALTTGRGLFASLAAGDWVFAGFDLTLLALASLHAALALALFVVVRSQGWGLGLVSYSGHTSLAAGVVFASLILYGRRPDRGSR